MAESVAKAYKKLDNLRNTQLATVPYKFLPLTSDEARGKNVTMGSFLCSSIRNALNLQNKAGEADSCDCCLIKAGSCPRGGKNYAADEQITLETLQSEIQAPNEVNIYRIPGVSRFLPFWRDCIACAGLYLWFHCMQGAQLNME